ncbi:MAG: hypothetical protein KDA81_21705 [Planctomycetaceae bacterium]|nr:hypothetical protein [Planctomycetaceae bacterium]
MSDQPQIEEDDERSDEQLTRIVSYLDGELDDTQMNEVEQALVADRALRDQAESLSRTWALLDALEDVSASRQFTQATLASVTADVLEAQKQSGSSGLKTSLKSLLSLQSLIWFIVGIVAGITGLAVSGAFRSEIGDQEENRVIHVMLNNLELLRNIEYYEVVPDADALKQVQLQPVSDTGSEDAPQ